MDKLIDASGNAAAAVGIVICLVTGVVRLAGGYYLFGYESITLFTGGIALMVMGCLAKLHLLTNLRKAT